MTGHIIEEAARVADVLKDLLRKQSLTKRIQGREHVLVEGWTTLGSMLGVVPIVEWARQTDDGWEARVVAKTLDGRVVGAAEASCTRSEQTWKSRDDYALRSMAQTRATSKALRGPLGFIVTLAGYEATPSEEMPSEDPPTTPALPFGPPLQKAHVETFARALAYFLPDRTPEYRKALFERIKAAHGGYMPDAAAVAMTLIHEAAEAE
jgi:hypothetical protein